MIKHFSRILIVAVLLLAVMIGNSVVTAVEVKEAELELDAKSAVLMDANTGTLLYALNKDEALPPASVTKIMTLLLVMEAIDGGTLSFDETVSVSEYAASMGGSQIFLEPGETMTVRDMVKSVVIASANDAAVALAERVAGSEEAFVRAMNDRAKELGMENTVFENVTGLDDDVTEHLISAYDIALASRELLKHPSILEYTSIWMDTVRNGEFGLTNTNRLIRFYNGATGLKTGSTSKAKFCISATAEREELHLIAVIMGASSRDARNISAQKLLDFGFANYAIYRDAPKEPILVPVLGGKDAFVSAEQNLYEILVNKGEENKIQRTLQLNEEVCAPVRVGDVVGTVVYTCDGKEIGRCDIKATQAAEKIGFLDLFCRILQDALFR